MDQITELIAKHGYVLIFGIALAEGLGLPVPAAIAMLVAGAASAWGKLSFPMAVASAAIPFLLTDVLYYWAGRESGWALLSLLCRVSLNPETCILRSAESFYKRGKMTLLFAKFVPGVATMAPPLAGSMKMPVSQFLRFDSAGVLMYSLAYTGAGYLFSQFLSSMLRGISAFGTVMEWLLVIGFVGFLAYRFSIYWKHRMYRVVPRVQVDQLAERLAAGESEVIVADVRSHGYYDREAQRIRGAIRLEPNNLDQFFDRTPKGVDIYLYCT